MFEDGLVVEDLEFAVETSQEYKVLHPYPWVHQVWSSLDGFEIFGFYKIC